jgi:hypothetical protein
MRVKHKDSIKNRFDPSVSLEGWHSNYFPNKRYLNYDFYDVPNIVDVYEIDNKTGNTIFFKSTFEYYAKRLEDSNPRKYVYKPLADNRLDEYLMPKIWPTKKYFLITKIKERIERIFKRRNSSKPTPFTRFERWTLFLMALTLMATVIIPIILSIMNR